MVSNYASIQMGRIQREMPRPVRPTAASSTDASGGAKNSKYCWLQPDAYTFFFSFDILGSLKCHPPRKRWRTYRRNRPPLQSTENACLSRFYYFPVLLRDIVFFLSFFFWGVLTIHYQNYLLSGFAARQFHRVMPVWLYTVSPNDMDRRGRYKPSQRIPGL